MDILKDLNKKQKEAVQTTEGPVLIIAGPGSGKTQVLTHRIAYLISKNKVNPANILAVTFTNKAATEMRQRISSLLFNKSRIKTKQKLPTIGTFHGICAKILRQEISLLGFKKRFTIYDKDDQLSLIKEVMKSLEINPEIFHPGSVLNAISSAKSELIDEKTYRRESDEYFQKTISQIYTLYQKKLKEANALDFEDLIFYTVTLFKKFPEILKKYQKHFCYILIDEYQDTNFSQYTLTRLLAQEHKNICTVGDDWQSIYSFRGADVRNILEFEKDYPQAKIIMLEESYRSTQTILDAASSIISKNTHCKDKKLWTQKSSGVHLAVFEAENERAEAEFVASEIENLMRNHEINSSPLKLRDFAVLYRINAQSRILEEAFLKHNIDYKIVGGLKFYSRKEIKDLIAYLKIIENPDDIISFQRIINVPPRGIGKVSLKKILEGDIGECRLRPKSKAHISLNNFKQLIESFRRQSQKLPLSKLLKFIIDKTGYDKYIQDGSLKNDARWENIEELFSLAQEYDHLNPQEGLSSFLEKVSLATDADEIESKKDLVNLMTLHAAKGLEFSVVFIVGLEEGLLPYSRSLNNSNEIEEERRLCYVGINRAKEKVYLVFARVRNFRGVKQANLPSRFLKDIPENLIDYYSFE